MLAYSIGLMVTSRALRVCIVFLAISLVIAIGFSRIYLGVHYFSDVIAGYLAASSGVDNLVRTLTKLWGFSGWRSASPGTMLPGAIASLEVLRRGSKTAKPSED
jgi:membrane-associated phospholipid phosphatase